MNDGCKEDNGVEWVEVLDWVSVWCDDVCGFDDDNGNGLGSHHDRKIGQSSISRLGTIPIATACLRTANKIQLFCSTLAQGRVKDLTHATSFVECPYNPSPLLCSIGLKAHIPVEWLELILPLTLSYIIFKAIGSSEIHSFRALGLGSFNLVS
ncbi:hypothetical protein V6N13_116184 [Hibiscus sabdariffa]|uniref:Uncharacterized protein n=1 Tax=Hibiscus sabdariffa TaxID=183260 RepID=A0ABR2PBU9_9ROSI